MRLKNYILILASLFTASYLLPAAVSAATLYLSLSKDVISIGDQFSADVKIDSEGIGINAAQAAIRFPNDILEVVSVDGAGSVFNFWLEDPAFSNEDGKISFIGGSTSGFSGKTLQTLKINFKVKGSGQSELVFLDAAVTASDGSGTNVLSAMKGAPIISVLKSELPTIESRPQQITRPATAAEGLPIKPVLDVSLYPVAKEWYNLSSPFSVRWELPADITDVATALNKEPFYTPSKSEGLFDNKNFKALDDGIWYLHVRFGNNLGWGPTVHYRLAIDTVPPLAFDVQVAEGLSTDNPTPTLTYQTGDQFSGLDHYFIRIGDGDLIKTDQSFYVLPLQAPGKHFIRVGAEDRAGNITDKFVELEILPIASPIIDSVTLEAIVDEDNIKINGTAIPGETVKLFLKKSKGPVASVREIKTDERGNWQAEFEQPIKKGKYFIEAQTVDSRSAVSLQVKSSAIRVKERPLLTVAGFDITQFWLLTFIILLLLIGFVGGWLTVRLAKTQRSRKVVVAQRDIVTVFSIVKKDLDKILESYHDKKIDEREASEIEFLLKRININIEKMQQYLLENIKEIND